VFIEDYADIASRVGRFDRAVVKFGYSCCLGPMRKKSVLRCLRLVGLQSSKKNMLWSVMEESNASVKVRGIERKEKLSVICIEAMIQRQR